MKIQVLSTERNSRFVVRVGGFVIKLPNIPCFVRNVIDLVRRTVVDFPRCGGNWSEFHLHYTTYLLNGLFANHSEQRWSKRFDGKIVQPILVGCDLLTMSRFVEPTAHPIHNTIRAAIIRDGIARCYERMKTCEPIERARLDLFLDVACSHGFDTDNWVVRHDGKIVLVDFGSSASRDVAKIVWLNRTFIEETLAPLERQIKTALSL